MNFLFFSAQFLPHMGGVENYTYNISKELVSRGHQVTVLTNNTTKSLNREEYEGIQILRFESFNFLHGRFPVYKKNKIYKSILQSMKQNHFDFAIINTRFYTLSLFGAKYCCSKKIPFIIIDHGTSHLTVQNPFLDWLGANYEHLFTFVLKKYCKHFFAVSRASSIWLNHFKIQSEGELYNSIDLKKIEALKERKCKSYRKIFNIPDKAIVISFTGRLIKEKGILQLIKSIQNINKSNSNKVYLFIAGEGKLDEYIREQNSNFIISLGRLSFEDVISLLQDSNVFVLPSDSEGFSSSILEAAACGNYIITTARGGAKELLLDNSYGMILDVNDVNTIQNGIQQCLSMSDRNDAVSKTYHRIKENFTWPIVSNKILSIADFYLEKVDKDEFKR